MFSLMNHDSCVENMISNGELIMGSDGVLSMVCDDSIGDCELKVEE